MPFLLVLGTMTPYQRPGVWRHFEGSYDTAPSLQARCICLSPAKNNKVKNHFFMNNKNV